MTKWVTVSIRSDLANRVKRVVNSGIGYRSLSDFVSEAVRLRLEQIEAVLVRTKPTPVGRGGGDVAANGPTRGDEPNPSVEGKEER